MKDWLIVVPWIGPEWNIRGLLETVEIDLLDRFVFVDNSRDGGLHDFRLGNYGAKVVSHPENLGFCGSANVGIMQGHAQTVICSSSVRFTRGLRYWLEEAEELATEAGLVTFLEFHLVAFGRALVEQVGRMDENFYPGEWSDNDYFRRIRLAGRNPNTTPGAMGLKRPMACTRAGYNLAQKATGFKDNPRALLAYYARKWGGEPGHETHDKPFGDKPLEYWPGASVATLKERYGLPSD